MDNILQLLTDPENQPHQYVGDPESLRALIEEAMKMKPIATPNQVKVSVSLEKCAFAASNLRAHKGMPDAYDYEITKAILEAAKAQGARFDYVE